MLDDRTRVILFWFTIGMMVLVVVVAAVTLVRTWHGSLLEETALVIRPAEVGLCTGDTYSFTVAEGAVEGAEIIWKATGGEIGVSGVFMAGDKPGDYTVTAVQRKPRQVGSAVVHIALCTPTPWPTPTPLATPTPLPTATPLPPTPTPTPVVMDAQGDVELYESGGAIEGAPAHADIRAASVAADMHVTLQPGDALPAELVSWAGEGDVVLWISFYAPIPEPPAYTDWLFSLDLDGNLATGRPAGSARINPDLGDEVVIGLLYDAANGSYAPYFLVWDPNQGAWVDGPDVPRFTMGQSRTVLGLALPMETLIQSVAQTTGVTVVPEAVRGRAAVLSFVGDQAVIDFYPNRP